MDPAIRGQIIAAVITALAAIFAALIVVLFSPKKPEPNKESKKSPGEFASDSSQRQTIVQQDAQHIYILFPTLMLSDHQIRLRDLLRHDSREILIERNIWVYIDRPPGRAIEEYDIQNVRGGVVSHALTGLRTQLLSARSVVELRECLLSIEEFLWKHPNHSEGVALKFKAQRAIELELARKQKQLTYWRLLLFLLVLCKRLQALALVRELGVALRKLIVDQRTMRPVSAYSFA